MNIITFDIEDWYNHDDYSRDFDWDKHEVRIYEGVDKILSALEDKRIKGTFFCLGWIAEKHPAIIRKISGAGHHIGCHSYQHELATRLTPDKFKADIYKAKSLIEDTCGKEVNAFRVPSFSINNTNLWVFEVLAALGFKYDSSIFPSTHEFGGFPGIKLREPFLIKVGDSIIKEFPVNLKSVFGRKIIYSGGGYFRVVPYSLIYRWTKQTHYTMSYFHPSDFDPGQPHMPQLSLMRQLKNRIGLKYAYAKFKKYLDDFDLIALEYADEIIDWENRKIINYKDLANY